MKRAYLAGPMGGYPGRNHARFHEAARRLRALGYEVWSPAEYDETNIKTPGTRSEKILEDLRQVSQSDVVALLPGWELAPGACAEVALAQYLRIHTVPVSSVLEGVE